MTRMELLNHRSSSPLNPVKGNRWWLNMQLVPNHPHGFSTCICHPLPPSEEHENGAGEGEL